MDKGHGRIEARSIRVSSELTDYIDFPYAKQVFVIHRVSTDLNGRPLRADLSYGITSLSPEEANPARLLELNRNHWSIECSLHWVRDVTFDEDRSRIRKHSGPQVMATLRNLAISILRMAGARYIAKATRHCAWDWNRTFRLIGLAVA